MTRHHFYIAGLVIVLLAVTANAWLGLENHAEVDRVVVRLGENVQRVKRDEAATKKTAAHTRTVQVQGGPPAVCLREGIEAALPELERLPHTGPPFQAYARLQQHRYPGVVCPDK